MGLAENRILTNLMFLIRHIYLATQSTPVNISTSISPSQSLYVSIFIYLYYIFNCPFFKTSFLYYISIYLYNISNSLSSILYLNVSTTEAISVCLSVCPCACLSFSPSVRQSIRRSVGRSVGTLWRGPGGGAEEALLVCAGSRCVPGPVIRGSKGRVKHELWFCLSTFVHACLATTTMHLTG